MHCPRIIVTGASGFVGRHLIDEILDEFEMLSSEGRGPCE